MFPKVALKPLTVLTSLFLALFTTKAQDYSYLDVNNFSGIKSEGQIPPDFTETWASKFEKANQISGSSHMQGRNDEVLENFWSEQYYVIDGLMHNGRVCFNDPISDYLNNIKNNLLQDDPDLKEALRVYLYRAPFVNAFAVSDGIIMVSTGLFAHAETEAELAFVIAHEIQHYKEQHLFERFEERERLLREKVREYRKLHPLQKEALLLSQNREHEFEADEKGLQLFLKSKYSLNASERVLTMLHQSYMPYGDKEVGSDFLATDKFQLPSIFFRDSVSVVTREEDYFDETHTHPNIAKRRAALQEILKGRSGGSMDFVQPREQFYALRNLARFERVRELILYGSYGEALYDIYYLRDQYPASKFLDLAQAKALYALAGFKVKRAYREVARITSRVEGPSQQVHHILKQFDKNQLAAYALHIVRYTQQKYPEEKFLATYASELTKYMLVDCRLSAEDFHVANEALPPFEGKPKDYRSERQYFRAQQSHYRDLYKYVVQDEYKSGWLGQRMEKHQWLIDSIARHQQLDRRDKRDQRKEWKKEWEEGTSVHVRKLVMLDPSLNLRKEDQDRKDYYKNFEKEMEFKRELPALASEQGIEAVFLFSEEMDETDVEKYNHNARLKEWINEASFQYQYGLRPTCVDVADELEKVSSARYICTVKGNVQDGSDSYIFTLYDIKKGKVVYKRADTQGFRLSLRDLLRETEDDLQRIYN